MTASPHRRPRLQWKVQLRQTMQKWHLWSTLIVGLFIVVVTTTGVAALFERDLNQATHPALFRVTPGVTITLDQARAQAAAQFPGWVLDDSIIKQGRPDIIRAHRKDHDDDRTNIYVDPGTGRVNGTLSNDKTVLGWLTRVHITLLAEGVKFNYPKSTPPWFKTLIGATLSNLLLKLTALALLVMVISGAYLWWPRKGQWKKAWQIRRSPKQYIRDLDWHKVVGAASLPFLFMWAVTGLNFFEPFRPAIKTFWYAATFAGKAPPEPGEVKSKLQTGKSPISAEQARAIAKRTLPKMTFVSYTPPHAKDDPVTIYLARPIDPYSQNEWPGDVTLKLDAYSGRVLENSAAYQLSLGASIYERWFTATHFGSFVPWPVRLIWGLFGLAPLLLAFTGVRMWWHKRVSRLRSRERQKVRPRIPLNQMSSDESLP